MSAAVCDRWVADMKRDWDRGPAAAMCHCSGACRRPPYHCPANPPPLLFFARKRVRVKAWRYANQDGVDRVAAQLDEIRRLGT